VETLCNPVIALRIGANDLLGAIGLKRQPGQTVYDTPLRSTIERLITLFRPAGFELAAPVCDLIGEPDTLSREVVQDIAWGFHAKTCVHPAQIALVEEHFAQAMARQTQQAYALLNSSDAVFKDNGQMLEATCHTSWAERIASLQAKPG
jgi:citrate lyase beta subunit